MSREKKYWKSEVELSNSVDISDLKHNEFAEKLPIDLEMSDELVESSTNRRDFLKYLGFSTSAAILASCEGPVHRSVPYVIQPERIRPGIANYYATTMFDGYDASNILVKTREGRPIKIENNKLSKYNGSANARVHASVLSMYDSGRLQGPVFSGEDITWENLDKQVLSHLKKSENSGKNIYFITNTIVSPTSKKIIKDFTEKYKSVKHIEIDAVSETAILDAHQIIYGIRALPFYDIDKANFILSLGADFLGDWMGSSYDKGYVKNRIPQKKNNNKAKMSRHIQIESNMSITGSNADIRIPAKPSIQKQVLAYIYNKLESNNSPVPDLEDSLKQKVDTIIEELVSNGKKSILLCGLDDIDSQIISFRINEILKSEIKSKSKVSMLRSGDHKKLKDIIDDYKNGLLGGIIMSGVNPVYSFPDSIDFKSMLSKIDFSLNFSMKMDETSVDSKYVAACPHYLESWGDFEFINGEYSLCQPTIKPLFDTRQFEDCLIKWSGSEKSYYDEIRTNWESNILKNGTIWNKVLHDGIYSVDNKIQLRRITMEYF